MTKNGLTNVCFFSLPQQKKTVKKSLPTDPIFFEAVTGNKHILFLGLTSGTGLGVSVVDKF